MCARGHRYTGSTCSRCQRSGASRPELNRATWQKLRAAVRRRDGGQCRVCATDLNLSVHHIERGGPDTLTNLILLCSRCHAWAERGDLTVSNTDLTLNDVRTMLQ